MCLDEKWILRLMSMNLKKLKGFALSSKNHFGAFSPKLKEKTVKGIHAWIKKNHIQGFARLNQETSKGFCF